MKTKINSSNKKIMTILGKSAAALIIAAISLAGCKSAPTMTMTTAKEGKVAILMAGTGTATIDWGDGSAPETVTLKTIFTDYTRVFPGATSRNIVIKGRNITYLNCGGGELTALDVSKNTALTELYCFDNRLTSLDVSKNTGLTGLYCFLNKLTSLDVTKNTALTELWCHYNQFATAGLNTLFGTLPATNTDDKEIYITGNPGADACDKSIATKKRWEVMDN